MVRIGDQGAAPIQPPQRENLEAVARPLRTQMQEFRSHIEKLIASPQTVDNPTVLQGIADATQALNQASLPAAGLGED